MPSILPPGVSPSDFAAALAEFRAAVGPDWVFTSEEDLDTYRDAYSLRWGDPDEYLASAAVAPDTVEEVQKIVLTANKHRIPLYPISTGKNLAYGGSAPTYSGSVVVDLKRMNRVLRVDDKRNFALVEPGVSYFDLYRYIQERGLKVWIDCPDPGWGSPIGNALDHGMGYTAAFFRDHFGAHCGMEVVTPTGEIVRTGMGALPGADTWQDYRYGVGPWVDGLFGQANFGIVTKMGFWLYPQPEAWGAGTVSVERHRDLDALIDQVNYLEDAQLATGLSSYSSPLGAVGAAGSLPGTLSPELAALVADGWPDDDRIEAFVKAHGVPAWQVRLQFYGPEKTIQASWEYAQERIGGAIPGASFHWDETLKLPFNPDHDTTHHLVTFGVPNMVIFRTIERTPDNPPNGREGHADLIVVCPRSGEAFRKAQRVIYETQKELGLPISTTPFRGPITWAHRCFLIGPPSVSTYRDDREANARARRTLSVFVERLAAAGYGAYRTNPSMQDLVVQQYAFNNHALLRFQEALKDGIDPNGIMAPGRYGLWPRRIRESRTASPSGGAA